MKALPRLVSNLRLLLVASLYCIAGPLIALAVLVLPSAAVALATILLSGASAWLIGKLSGHVRAALGLSLLQVLTWVITVDSSWPGNWRGIGAYYVGVVPVLVPLVMLCSGISASLAADRHRHRSQAGRERRSTGGHPTDRPAKKVE